MPKSDVPFLYLKKQPRSFFSTQNKSKYLWSPISAGIQHDISISLLEKSRKEWMYHCPFAEKISTLLSHADDSIKKQSTQNFWQSKKVFINLDVFAELNDIGSWQEKSILIKMFLNEIDRYLEEGFTIGINFREVFLVPENEEMPPHFRPGIDICVRSIADYIKMTNQLSYQLGKAMFYQYKPSLPPRYAVQDSLNQIITDYYSNSPYSTKWDKPFIDYTTPLKDFRYFDSVFGCFVIYQLNNHYIFRTGKYYSNPKIVALTYPVTISELLPFFQNCNLYDSPELTIVLKGHQYENEGERQSIYKEILRLVKESKITSMVHVILITKDNLDANLLALKPGIQEKSSLFQPLPQGAGYYLSPEPLLSEIYRNIQGLESPENFNKNFGLLNKIYKNKPKKQPGAYIQAQIASENRRKSKTFSRAQLKSRVRLAVAQQESIAQNKVMNQQQEIQQQVINEESTHSSVFAATETSWEFKVNLERFSRKLQTFAKKTLPEVLEEEQVSNDTGYLTEFYLKHHSRSHFYEQLATDESFRLHTAARLFGTALVATEEGMSSPLQIKLPAYAVDNMENYVADSILQNIEGLRDGFFEKNRQIRRHYLFGKTICGYKYYRAYCSFSSHTLVYSNLWGGLSPEQDGVKSFVQPFQRSILLTDEEISDLEEEKKQTLIQAADSLLNIFKPHPSLNQEEIQLLEQQLLVLFRFYCPDRGQEIGRVEQFMERFIPHNEDNLKILLQILIYNHKNGLDSFLKLLAFLDERGLLDFFYKICFQYAVKISSIEELLRFPLSSSFLRLSARIPKGKPNDEWPNFERFCLHLSIFAAQNNFKISIDHLRSLEMLWGRLYLKFLAYTGNQEEEAQELLKQLTLNLIDDKGLCIAPVTRIETFYTGLENFIDHAMSKHVLREQIEEIKGISLLPMDALYACTANGFYVISPEMQIQSTAINPKTKAYSISQAELLAIITRHQPNDNYLKIALFRYLGTQNLRKDLAVYRKLYGSLTLKTTDPDKKFILEILCAYYVAYFTGNGFYKDMDPEKFSKQFFDFLKNNNLIHSLPSHVVASCIDEFIQQLNEVDTIEKKGLQSLWSIWQERRIFAYQIATTPIPEIFLRKFPAKNLGRFLLNHKDNLLKALPSLNNDRQIVWSLLNAWTEELNLSQEHKIFVKNCLEKLYPKLDMELLLRDVHKITIFLNSITSLNQSAPKSLIYLALDCFLDKAPNKDSFFSLLELIAAEMVKHQKQGSKDKLAIQFVMKLRNKPLLYQGLPQTKDLIRVLFESYLTIEVKKSSLLLINLMETLLPLGIEESYKYFTELLPAIETDEGVDFLNSHSNLNALHLKEIAQFLHSVRPHAFAWQTLDWLYQQKLSQELPALISLLNQKTEDENCCLLLLGQIICNTTGKSLLEQVQKLNNKPLRALKKITLLHKLKTINAEEIIELLASSSLEEAIAQIQRKKNRENLQRYHYDPKVVREKIARIRLKSHESEADIPLDDQEEDQLWSDYQLLMSYMTQKTLKINIRGINKEVTINELDETEFQLLFKEIQSQLSKGLNVHRNKLLLIALSAEALYRTTNKFPRCTQFLTLLKHVNYPGNIIHEIKTGEGKSIVGAMHAALLCAGGRTVDITTENDQLAKNALEKFAPFYEFLGIPHGTNIITAQSAYSEYSANGINYSTASNLSLFRIRMALEKKSLPTNPSLVGDEIDAALTSTIQYRLAATLDPELNDTNLCAQLYQVLLEFVQEKEIYLNNPCSPKDDIANFKNYCIAKNSNNEFLTLTQKLSDELLGTLIESAMIAHELEEKEDYYVIKMKEEGKEYHYAAPIITSTKRPDPHVSYSEHVQQLLHTLLNNKKPAPALPFKIEASTETILVNSAKNFFDYYRLHDGTIIGLTGTAGSHIERAEFFEQQGLAAFSYPTFYPDLCKDLGLVTAFGQEEHLHKTLEWIKQHKERNPTQPILLITRSPQATEQFRDLIESRTHWKTQSYHGFEEAGKSEDNVIYTAGKDEFLTVANQSLARGADIDPDHEDGLLVINTCTDLTPSELRQIQGRAARNGKPGQFISIIDAQNLGTPSDTPETLAAAYKNHQLNISLQQQQERAKSRLLEETRYFMVSQVLKLRETADKILASQFGEEYSVVDQQQLLRTLSSLNKNAENHYAELLERYPVIDEQMIQEFLSARAKDFQQVVDKWLPEDQYSHVQFLQPSVPLENLKNFAPQLRKTTVKQLRCFAEIFHCKWKLDGHKRTQQNLDNLDELVEFFQPYFKKKCSFKQALGHALEEKGFLDTDVINDQASKFKTSIDEMLEYAQSIALIGRFVPVERIRAYVAEYLDTTKTQIREKKWDDIQLPTIDISSIGSWFSGISQTLAVGSLFVGGPIPFIVNRYIVPTIFGWIKKALKRRFANSDSLVAQILIGIDDIGNDLQEAINALTTLANENDITVGLLLDKFGPLAKNKALLMVLTKYLELIENPEYIPWVQVIPDLLPILEKYRDCKLDEMLNVDTIMVFLQHAGHSNVFLKLVENTPYSESLHQLSQLDSNFIKRISSFSFPEFINILKIIAHPNFFAMMHKLPEETTYEELLHWLGTMPGKLPPKTQQALQELLDYQNNHERIAEENKQILLNLRNTYHLTTEKFKEGLEKLRHKIKTSPEPETSVEAQSMSYGFKYVALLVVIAVLIVYSILYLSLPVALACCSLAVWMVFPYLYKQVSEPGDDTAKSTSSEDEDDGLSFILTDNPQSRPENEERPVKDDLADMPNNLASVADSRCSFFREKIGENYDPLDEIMEEELNSTRTNPLELSKVF